MGVGCIKLNAKVIPINSVHSNVSHNSKRNSRKISRLSISNNPQSIRRGNILTRKLISLYLEGSSGEQVADNSKSSEDMGKIMNALNSHFIFTSLTEEDKELIAEAMILYSFVPETVVFRQGTPSRSYYIIKKGIVDVIVNGQKVNRLIDGDGFGELALLHDNERSATIRCIDFTMIWSLDRDTFKKLIENVSTHNFEQNRAYLDRINLLNSLTQYQKDALAANMTNSRFHPGQTIITEGDPGDMLYIIKEGIVSVMKRGVELNQLHVGSYFGEQALISNNPRNATCIAKDGLVKCVCLSRSVLFQVLNYHLQDIIEQNTIMEGLNRSENLSLLKRSQKEAILKDINIVSYKAGDIVIPKGASCCSKIYIIISGRLQNSKSTMMFAEKGHCIGDTFLISKEDVKYEDDIISANNMRVGEMTRYQLEATLGGKYDEIIKENTAVSILRKISLFSTIPDSKMRYLLSIIRIQKFKKSEIILREGNNCFSIYIVKRGKVDVFKVGKLVRSITKLGYFGEDWIINDNILDYTYVASTELVLWVLLKSEFQQLVNPLLENNLRKSNVYLNFDIELQDLSIINLLGRGMFSRVYFVKHIKGLNYALKIYSRRKVQKLRINQQIINEKQIMSQINHQFIAKFIKSFKDEIRIYLLMEYVSGYDLETIIRNIGLLSARDAAFYIGSLIIVLQYLHERDILYRDLKPENVLVDENGYIKLIDFNSAKVAQNKTYTLVGCPYYRAPEVIAGRGFSKNSDIWSLGVMLYEFLCGKLPFGQDQEDPYKIFEEILENKLDFPQDIPLSEAAMNLIKTLLNKFPENRHSGPIEKLKMHEFFTSFDWEDLYCNTAIPPFKSSTDDNLESQESLSDQAEAWDIAIQNDTDDSSESLPEICDSEIEEYSSMIPSNWDDAFN